MLWRAVSWCLPESFKPKHSKNEHLIVENGPANQKIRSEKRGNLHVPDIEVIHYLHYVTGYDYTHISILRLPSKLEIHKVRNLL